MALTEFDARPQTNLQLYALLLEAGRDATELRSVRDAYALATQLFAGLMRPEGRPFVCHIVGVAGILAMLDASLPTVVGGLLHSAYTHGDFGRGCGEVHHAARDRVRAAVGGEIEGIVSAYAALSWNAPSVDRYAAEVGETRAGTRRILVIRLANELEDALDDGLRLSRKSENPHRAIVVDNLVTLAMALGQPRLAMALQSALGQRRAVPELELLQQSPLGSYVVGPSSWRERMLPRIVRLGRRIRAGS
jgi:(p)ppGpp synthase/HD superfamily hydrolase